MIFKELLTLVDEHDDLHNQLIVDLQAIWGKYEGMVALGIASIGGFNTTQSFLELFVDNSLI